VGQSDQDETDGAQDPLRQRGDRVDVDHDVGDGPELPVELALVAVLERREPHRLHRQPGPVGEEVEDRDHGEEGVHRDLGGGADHLAQLRGEPGRAGAGRLGDPGAQAEAGQPFHQRLEPVGDPPAQEPLEPSRSEELAHPGEEPRPLHHQHVPDHCGRDQHGQQHHPGRDRRRQAAAPVETPDQPLVGCAEEDDDEEADQHRDHERCDDPVEQDQREDEGHGESSVGPPGSAACRHRAILPASPADGGRRGGPRRTCTSRQSAGWPGGGVDPRRGGG
jgi:hypothetical protein